MFKLTLERQIPLAFIIVILLLAVIGFISWRSASSIDDAFKLQKHTQEVLLTLDDLLILTLNAETGSRGYINTGKDSFLDALQSSQTSVPENISQLRKLVIDNPEQMARLKNLEIQVNDKLLYLRQATELRRSQGLSEAINLSNKGRGEELMVLIRQSVNDMKSSENILLAERETDLTNRIMAQTRCFYWEVLLELSQSD